jgi:hypothetical protein
MSRHRRSRPRRFGTFAATGALVVGVSMSGSPAGAADVSAPVSGPSTDSPPRVTGFSTFFDYCQTGSTLAVPLGYGLGTAAINLVLAQLPAQAQPVTDQVLLAEATGPQVFDQMAGPSRDFIDGGRTAVAPLAAYNAQANDGLHAAAEGTRSAAKAAGPLLQPADLSLYQVADLLDSLRTK